MAAGASRPLLETPVDARHVHGNDGMGDLEWPRSTRSPRPGHDVEMLRDVLMESADGPEDQRVTLVPLAPMTNIALLLSTYPEVARGLRRMVFMGWAMHVGNATASAEFNVFHDPEAAAIALDACADLGRPGHRGRDVRAGRVLRPARQPHRGPGPGRAPQQRPGRAGRMAFQCERFETDSATLGDAGAVCAVLDPEGMSTERLPVPVELAGTWSRGRTIVDRRDWDGNLAHDPHGQAPALIDMALAVEVERYARLWLETVTGAP